MKRKEEIRNKIKVLWDEWEGIKKLTENEKRQLSEEESKRSTAIFDEIDSLDEELSKLEKIDELEARALAMGKNLNGNDTKTSGNITADKQNVSVGEDRQAFKPFANLGEQLRAIYLAATRPELPVDKRLIKLNEEVRSISGMGEDVPADGGFALQQDFGGMILESAVTDDPILSRVDSYNIGSGSNSAKWVECDETSIQNDIFGGVQVYWEAEGEEGTATHPKLRKRELSLKKLFGIAYATDELLEDTTFISQLYTKAFTLAIQRKLGGDIIDGSGAGRLLGILNSDRLVSVAKETNQAADTVVWENLSKMWNRLLPIHRENAVWLVNPDVEEQLDFLSFPVGTGGVPVYLPAGGASVAGYSTLKGRPVISTDHCKALGDKGDIILADLNDYILIKKGGVKQDVSMHVRFIYAEQTFRFIYRANGQPKKLSPITMKNTANARSSFVSLNARA